MCASASSLADNNWFNPSTKMKVTAEGNLQFSALSLQSFVTFSLSFLTLTFFCSLVFPLFFFTNEEQKCLLGITRNKAIVAVIHLKKRKKKNQTT